MSGGVDSASRSVVVELKSAPGSELETADPLDHLHKIGQGIPSTGFHPKFHIDSGALGKRPGNMAAVSSGVKENKIEHHMMHPHPMQVS